MADAGDLVEGGSAAAAGESGPAAAAPVAAEAAAPAAEAPPVAVQAAEAAPAAPAADAGNPGGATNEQHAWLAATLGLDPAQYASPGSFLGGLADMAQGAAGAITSAVAGVAGTIAAEGQAVVAGAGGLVGAAGNQLSNAMSGDVGDAVQAAPAGPPPPPPAPDTPADPAKQALYLKEAGDAKDVSENDIHQGQVGDCFVLSSVGEIAKLDPEQIKKMVKDNGDGTYTVTLHQKDDGVTNLGGLFGHRYKEVQVTVNGDTPAASVNHGAGQSEEGGKKEIWPLVLEKAYAKANGGYDKIKDGGSPQEALEQLTGKDADTKWANAVSLKDLEDAQAKGKPIVFNTGKEDDPATGTCKELPFGMHGSHAYMFDKLVKGPDGTTYVKLKNPWGYGDPQLIPYDQLPTAVQTVTTGSL